MDRRAVLIVSNGYGEDAVGAVLARHLTSHADLAAFPLVGRGPAYAGLPLLGPRDGLPSGGFGARGRGWLEDIRAGGIGFVRRQRRALRTQRGRCHLAVAVGDAFCLWMAAAAGSPVILIATAKSIRHDPHNWLDVRVMRALAAAVYTRDDDTAGALRAQGIDAAYVGNPLMDAVGAAVGQTMRRSDRHVVTLLPGSRQEAYHNLFDLLRLASVVAQRSAVTWVCALAPTIDPDAVASSAVGDGWRPSGSWGLAADRTLQRDEVQVALTTDFARAVRDADIVVSLAGTASEQAAGMGKPVIAFPGSGPQFTAKFLDAQLRLLGEALVATPTWTEAAAAVVRLLQDPEERMRRGAAGRLRMGPPGALARIRDEILQRLASKVPGGMGTLSR